MISQNAVTAALREFNGTMLCQDFDNRDATVAMRAALSVALQALLEGKREEMAKVIDPEIYSPHSMVSLEWTNAREIEALVKADRIIAMLGGGE